MGERKVLNKYYPADFNPALLPKKRMRKNQQMKVTNMLPMSIRCKACRTYMYKGTKYNMRKEDVIDETYLNSIRVYRFYFKCSMCSSEITIKTDPQNHDYIVEYGASRNSEPWRSEGEVFEKKQRKSLENRTRESKREMDVLSNLDTLKNMKSGHAQVSMDRMLAVLQRSDQVQQKHELEEADEEALIKSIFHGNIRKINDDTIISKKRKLVEGPADLKKTSEEEDMKARVTNNI